MPSNLGGINMFPELDTDELLNELAAELTDALKESGHDKVHEDSIGEALDQLIGEAEHVDDLPHSVPLERKRVVVESYVKLGGRK